MTTVRRRGTAAALAATAVLCGGGAGTLAVAPAAQAAPSPSPSAAALPAGLYGTKDPTYDGVWRQSFAFLAQKTSGVDPADQAVDWLLRQQCDDGAFAAYRPDPGKPCDAATVLDTNATAAAVQALAGLDKPEAADGETDPVTKALRAGVHWLKGVQNKDGGWSYNPGGASDANSTSIVIGALAAAGEKPGTVKSADGRSPYDALVGFAIPCSAKDAGAGAFAYQPDQNGKLVANADATAAAVLAGLGKQARTRGAEPGQPPTCEAAAKPTAERVARNGAAYLATALAKTGHLDLPPMPGAETTAPAPDFGNTADAVVALGAAGHGDKAAGAVAWLKKNGPAWAAQNGPAAWAQLILAAHTVGADTRDFGGVDLVQRLNATGPTPESTDETRAKQEHENKESGENTGFGVWLVVGVFLFAGMGIGFLISGRNKNRQP
ncbi:prenyltransferase/squalene oxidase repeat-containing protein [Streptomyces sp. NPDC045431]|uniref:prenyltransferase/squalene oxidase repeat-containing protein n=1 Tax=Streptomyces sp. NPDC045431 TaxID=3155613 RepID=UPI0033FBAED0